MKLKIIDGLDKGKIIRLEKNKRFIIGRDKSCDIALNDTKASRKHAKIFFELGSYYFEDLNSTNGSTVNGKTTYKIELCDGDEICTGNTIFLIKDILGVEFSKTSSLKLKDEGFSTVIVSSMPYNEADILSQEVEEKPFDDLLAENKVLRKVCEISQVISVADGSHDVLVDILDLMQDIFYADTACILIWSENNDDWEVRAISSKINSTNNALTVSHTIIDQAMNEGIAILSSNPMTDERFDPSVSIISQGISSALCSPLKIHGKMKGVLFFARRNSESLFNSMDLRLTATVGNILSLFLEKEQLEVESRRKERLAVIGEVIAGLAHYTKNIITGLKFSISALEIVIKKQQPDSIKKCLKAISSQERRISDLVLNMLSYSKERVPVLSEFNILTTIDDVTMPYLNYFEENNISFEFVNEAHNPKVYGEEQALHRVFLNLIVNALDSFKHKSVKTENKINITLVENNENNILELRFFDTGCGIPAEKLSKIFNIFYSTKGSEGTGLGLAVVHKIIIEHKGTISVDSVENEWTEFLIRLPLKQS